MEKTLSLLIICLSITTPLLSQEIKQQYLELKIRPMELGASIFNFSLEYIPTEKFGAELNTGIQLNRASDSEQGLLSDTNFYALFQARFYASPKYGADRFYFGPYALYDYDKYNIANNQKTKQNIGVLGANLGYKWALKSRFIGDFALGLGQVLSNSEMVISNPMIYQGETLNLHVLFYISVGYRFAL